MSDLWGTIAASDWQLTPHISGRAATEADVAEGLAVFFVQGESTAASMRLPCCAIQLLEDGSAVPVVIIQAEHAPSGIVLGVRPLSGGNSVCLESEVQLLTSGFDSQGGT